MPPDDVAWTMTSGGSICVEQLVDRRYERGGAERRRGAERNHERPAAVCVGLVRRGAPSPDRASVARRHVANLRAEQLVEERVSGSRSDGDRLEPFDDQDAAQSELRRGDRRHAGVVRLHAAARDQRVGACASASAATSGIFRTLLPPNANAIASSRLTSRRGPPPRARRRLESSSTGGRSVDQRNCREARRTRPA